MRILVTGGAGYIGGTCVRRLIRDGHTAWIFDNLSTGVNDERLRQSSVINDLCHYDAILMAMRAFQPDAVFHLAALTSVPDSILNPEDYWRTNFIGTYNVLRAMREYCIPRIIFSSTAAVYAASGKAVTEESPVAPATPYSTSKFAAEQLIRDFSKAYGIEHTIFRYFNVSGADEDYRANPKHEAHVIPLLLKTALGEQDKFAIFGNDYGTADGTCLRDYIHVSDVVEAHFKALLSPQAKNRTFNLGSDRAHSVLELIDACQRVVGRRIHYTIEGRRAGDAAAIYACSARARAFGWSPKHDLISILQSAYQ